MSKVKTHFGQPAIFISANGFGGGALVEEFEIIVEDKGIVKGLRWDPGENEHPGPEAGKGASAPV